MKRFFIYFILISLNVHGHHSFLPDNTKRIRNLDVPSTTEFLWTTAMSYCNVYQLTYKMFIGVGVPVQKLVYSNNDIADILMPHDSGTLSETPTNSIPPFEFLRFREASQMIEKFVIENENFQNMTNTEDITTGLCLWNSIQDSMNDFKNNISVLTDQAHQRMTDMHIHQKNISNADLEAIKKLYLDIFDQTIHTVSMSTKQYKEAFIFLKKYNPGLKMNNNEADDKKDDTKDINQLKPREYTQVKLTKVYELYIQSLAKFYTSKSTTNTKWTIPDFIRWYDINSSKSIFDYMASNLLKHIVTLTEYMHEVYKYNKLNRPELITIVREYVSTNLCNIIDFIKTPLQNIIFLEDDDIIKCVEFSNSTYNGKNSLDTILNSNNVTWNNDRIQNIKSNWNDNYNKIITEEVLDKYNQSLYDTDINNNNKLMHWVELMMTDEQNGNVLESFIYAIIVIKNFENAVVCSTQNDTSNSDIENIIQNLQCNVDRKLKALYKYSIYPTIYHGENLSSNLWNNIVNNDNNIFNILDWLRPNVSSNSPHWPNNESCDKKDLKNLVQLASVSSEMLYDVTLTSINRLLKQKVVTDDIEKNQLLCILKNLKHSKHSYENITCHLMRYITVNMYYIDSQFSYDSDIKRIAIHELEKSIKYKIFANTELVIPAFKMGLYYTLQEPKETQVYSDHFKNINNIFFLYFNKTIMLEQNNNTQLEIINMYEQNIKSIYNKLRKIHQHKYKNHPYEKLLKYNLKAVKQMYVIVMKDLKKFMKLKIQLKSNDGTNEIKNWLSIATGIITEDFIRYDKYYQQSDKESFLYNIRYWYSISGIDITKKTKEFNYETIYKTMNTEITQNDIDNFSLITTTITTNDTKNKIINPLMKIDGTPIKVISSEKSVPSTKISTTEPIYGIPVFSREYISGKETISEGKVSTLLAKPVMLSTIVSTTEKSTTESLSDTKKSTLGNINIPIVKNGKTYDSRTLTNDEINIDLSSVMKFDDTPTEFPTSEKSVSSSKTTTTKSLNGIPLTIKKYISRKENIPEGSVNFDSTTILKPVKVSTILTTTEESITESTSDMKKPAIGNFNVKTDTVNIPSVKIGKSNELITLSKDEIDMYLSPLVEINETPTKATTPVISVAGSRINPTKSINEIPVFSKEYISGKGTTQEGKIIFASAPSKQPVKISTIKSITKESITESISDTRESTIGNVNTPIVDTGKSYNSRILSDVEIDMNLSPMMNHDNTQTEFPTSEKEVFSSTTTTKSFNGIPMITKYTPTKETTPEGSVNFDSATISKPVKMSTTVTTTEESMSETISDTKKSILENVNTPIVKTGKSYDSSILSDVEIDMNLNPKMIHDETPIGFPTLEKSVTGSTTTTTKLINGNPVFSREYISSKETTPDGKVIFAPAPLTKPVELSKVLNTPEKSITESKSDMKKSTIGNINVKTDFVNIPSVKKKKSNEQITLSKDEIGMYFTPLAKFDETPTKATTQAISISGSTSTTSKLIHGTPMFTKDYISGNETTLEGKTVFDSALLTKPVKTSTVVTTTKKSITESISDTKKSNLGNVNTPLVNTGKNYDSKTMTEIPTSGKVISSSTTTTIKSLNGIPQTTKKNISSKQTTPEGSVNLDSAIISKPVKMSTVEGTTKETITETISDTKKSTLGNVNIPIVKTGKIYDSRTLSNVEIDMNLSPLIKHDDTPIGFPTSEKSISGSTIITTKSTNGIPQITKKQISSNEITPVGSVNIDSALRTEPVKISTNIGTTEETITETISDTKITTLGSTLTKSDGANIPFIKKGNSYDLKNLSKDEMDMYLSPLAKIDDTPSNAITRAKSVSGSTSTTTKSLNEIPRTNKKYMTTKEYNPEGSVNFDSTTVLKPEKISTIVSTTEESITESISDTKKSTLANINIPIVKTGKVHDSRSLSNVEIEMNLSPMMKNDDTPTGFLTSGKSVSGSTITVTKSLNGLPLTTRKFISSNDTTPEGSTNFDSALTSKPNKISTLVGTTKETITESITDTKITSKGNTFKKSDVVNIPFIKMGNSNDLRILSKDEIDMYLSPLMIINETPLKATTPDKSVSGFAIRTVKSNNGIPKFPKEYVLGNEATPVGKAVFDSALLTKPEKISTVVTTTKKSITESISDTKKSTLGNVNTPIVNTGKNYDSKTTTEFPTSGKVVSSSTTITTKSLNGIPLTTKKYISRKETIPEGSVNFDSATISKPAKMSIIEGTTEETITETISDTKKSTLGNVNIPIVKTGKSYDSRTLSKDEIDMNLSTLIKHDDTPIRFPTSEKSISGSTIITTKSTHGIPQITKKNISSSEIIPLGSVNIDSVLHTEPVKISTNIGTTEETITETISDTKITTLGSTLTKTDGVNIPFIKKGTSNDLKNLSKDEMDMYLIPLAKIDETPSKATTRAISVSGTTSTTAKSLNEIPRSNKNYMTTKEYNPERSVNFDSTTISKPEKISTVVSTTEESITESISDSKKSTLANINIPIVKTGKVHDSRSLSNVEIEMNLSPMMKNDDTPTGFLTSGKSVSGSTITVTKSLNGLPLTTRKYISSNDTTPEGSANFDSALTSKPNKISTLVGTTKETITESITDTKITTKGNTFKKSDVVNIPFIKMGNSNDLRILSKDEIDMYLSPLMIINETPLKATTPDKSVSGFAIRTVKSNNGIPKFPKEYVLGNETTPVGKAVFDSALLTKPEKISTVVTTTKKSITESISDTKKSTLGNVNTPIVNTGKNYDSKTTTEFPTSGKVVSSSTTITTKSLNGIPLTTKKYISRKQTIPEGSVNFDSATISKPVKMSTIEGTTKETITETISDKKKSTLGNVNTPIVKTGKIYDSRTLSNVEIDMNLSPLIKQDDTPIGFPTSEKSISGSTIITTKSTNGIPQITKKQISSTEITPVGSVNIDSDLRTEPVKISTNIGTTEETITETISDTKITTLGSTLAKSDGVIIPFIKQGNSYDLKNLSKDEMDMYLSPLAKIDETPSNAITRAKSVSGSTSTTTKPLNGLPLTTEKFISSNDTTLEGSVNFESSTISKPNKISTIVSTTEETITESISDTKITTKGNTFKKTDGVNIPFIKMEDSNDLRILSKDEMDMYLSPLMKIDETPTKVTTRGKSV